MASDRRHISITQLEMLSRCGQQYAFRYLDKIVAPPGIALARGRAVHKAAEANFRQKIESRQDLPRTEFHDIAAAAFDAEIAGGCAFDESDGRSPEAQIGDTRDVVVDLADLLATTVSPEYQPIAVEVKFEIPIGPAFDFTGVIDVADDQNAVVDIKTSGAKWSQADADNSLQLTAYASGFHHLFGVPAASLVIENLVTRKTGSDRQKIETTRQPHHTDILAARIDAARKTIDAGAFVPASPDDWCCSAKWCGYWSICPFAMRAKKSD